MLKKTRASILLYTLFATTFMIAFFAAFQGEIRSVVMRSFNKSDELDSRMQLSSARDLAMLWKDASSSKEYALGSAQSAQERSLYFVWSGQTLNIPIAITSTWALELEVDPNTSPVDIHYTSPLFSTGFALNPLDPRMIGNINSSGTLSLSSLGGQSKIFVKYLSATPTQSGSIYILSRSVWDSRESLGTLYLWK